MEPILRSRATIICGRVLSKENIFMFISTIEGRLVPSEIGDADECESVLEALRHIGSPLQGATLLLPSTPDAARCLIGAAFGRQSLGEQRLGMQTAALHALGNGEIRSQNAILNGDVEENLRRLIYEVATRSSKLTLLGLFLSILQQESEIRLAGYRVISGLVAQPWCLMEICSKQRDIPSFWCLLSRPLCRLCLIFQSFVGISRLMPLSSKCINQVMVAQTNSAIGLAFFSLGFPQADSYVGIIIPQILLGLKCFVYLQAVSISGHWICQIYAIFLGATTIWEYAYFLTTGGAHNHESHSTNIPTSITFIDACKKHSCTTKHCQTDASKAGEVSAWAVEIASCSHWNRFDYGIGTDFSSTHFLLNLQTVELAIGGSGRAHLEHAGLCATVSAQISMERVEFDEFDGNSVPAAHVAWDNALSWTWRKAIDSLQATLDKPEQLFHRKQLNISSEALSGTRARCGSRALDQETELDLFSRPLELIILYLQGFWHWKLPCLDKLHLLALEEALVVEAVTAAAKTLSLPHFLMEALAVLWHWKSRARLNDYKDQTSTFYVGYLYLISTR
ncbi:hypothetical protein Nepgr_008885 [Nepenthes gracilis]|uniref:Uncharacterized protein n=1 Tax=Nepenthes gracilis TaxID=150966 RepID=A0AAD3S9Z2_NEPGR|nr:hypothetical protein Nepgr_008885 [Nepenthes gracilis]